MRNALAIGAMCACVTCSTAFGIDVAGTIGTTIWAPDSSPFHVTAPCTVATGATLTIEPGVDVVFDGDFPLIVHGAVRAIGTQVDSIRFLPADTVSRWGGIRMSGGDSSAFAYTRIEKAFSSPYDHQYSFDARCGGAFAVFGSRLSVAHAIIRDCEAGILGAAIYATDSALVRFSDVRMSRNRGEVDFGGPPIYVRMASDLELVDCVVTKNMGGIAAEGARRVSLAGCAVLANVLDGRSDAGIRFGGESYGGSYLDVVDCVVAGNWDGQYSGGGIIVFNGDTRIVGSTVSGNRSAGRGGGILLGGTATFGGSYGLPRRTALIEGCVITGNEARFGGGVYVAQTVDVDIRNTTIAENVATDRGADLMDSGGRVAIENSILWNSTADSSLARPVTDVWRWPGSRPVMTLSYCNVTEGAPGRGNISADPLFTQPGTGDYSLTDGSPCIDAGSPYDLDVDASRADMGAFGGGGGHPQIPRVAVTDTSLDVTQGEDAFLIVHNTGWAELMVTGLDMPANVSYPMSAYMNIAPGDSLPIILTYTGDEDIYDTPAAVHTNDPHNPTVALKLDLVTGTPVQGALSGTWNAAGSPYRIVGPVQVSAESALNIESGVDVLFDEDVEFVVTGTLVVAGTAQDSVRFLLGAASEWGGIRVHGGDAHSLRYARISGAVGDRADIIGRFDWDPWFEFVGGGMLVTGSGTHVEIEHCVLSENTSRGWGGGICIMKGAAVDMTHCSLSDNNADRRGGGIYLSASESTAARLANCLIVRNSAQEGAGVYADVAVSITSCTIVENTATSGGGGALLTSRANVLNTIAWANSPDQLSGAVEVRYSNIQGGWTGEGNIDADPVLNADYALGLGSPCIDAGYPHFSDVDGSRSDMGWTGGAAGKAIAGPVSGRWTADESPYRIADDVIVAAGDTLVIEPGVDVLFDVVAKIYVDGVIQAVGTEQDSIRFLPGISEHWSGMRLHSPDSSSLAWCRFTGGHPSGSWSEGNGGALSIFGTGSSKARISHCVFVGNTAHAGGGVAVMDVDGMPDDSATVWIDYCIFTGNTAYRGGAVLFRHPTHVILTDCVIADNSVTHFGGGLEGDGNLTMVNCTVVRNGSEYDGGGVYAYPRGRLVVVNSIVRDNSPTQFHPFDHLEPGASRSVTYSNVSDGLPGEGNFDAEPRFQDAAGDDFRLTSDSPCIDAGDPAMLDPNGSRADVGAFRFDGIVAVTPVHPRPTSLLGAAPNPFNPTTAVRYTVARAGIVTLTVHNALGQRIVTIAGSVQQPGRYRAMWDGRTENARSAASGVYFVWMEFTPHDGGSPRRVGTCRVLLLR